MAATLVRRGRCHLGDETRTSVGVAGDTRRNSSASCASTRTIGRTQWSRRRSELRPTVRATRDSITQERPRSVGCSLPCAPIYSWCRRLTISTELRLGSIGLLGSPAVLVRQNPIRNHRSGLQDQSRSCGVQNARVANSRFQQPVVERSQMAAATKTASLLRAREVQYFREWPTTSNSVESRIHSPWASDRIRPFAELDLVL